MKTLIASALLATVAISGAAAAQQVSSGAVAAVAHFNESREGGDVVVLPSVDTVSISTRAPVSEAAFAIFNASADSQDEITGLNGSTPIAATPAYGADIFAALRAASLEDE